jgi:hypothetical protein
MTSAQAKAGAVIGAAFRRGRPSVLRMVAVLGLMALAARATPRDNALTAVTSTDYASAERFLPWNEQRYVVNADIQHHWLPGRDRFWYLRVGSDGRREFRLVDAASGKSSAAFAQDTVAAGLSLASGKSVAPGTLPFTQFRYGSSGHAIQFRAEGTLWTCQLRQRGCSSGALTRGALDFAAITPGRNTPYFPRNCWPPVVRH